MTESFTLHIFVPSGDPDGVRIVDRMNWTGKGIVVPRDRWSEVRGRSEIAQPGIYVLTGFEADELGNDRVVAYVGQSDNLRARIDGHDVKLEWWDRAMMFFSTNEGLNRAHITWLEWELIRRATNAKRCRLENRVEPTEPNLKESEKADTRAFLSEMLRIAPVMGVMIFDSPRIVQRKALEVAGLVPEARDVRDTIIVPAQRDGFERVFLGQNAWWAIRIAEKHRPNLKWIAGYQTLPVAAITHVAEIDHFEPYGEEGKWRVIFKGPAEAIHKPIPFGDAISGSMQGPRYTTHEALLRAQSVKDLLR
jgi:hypothetical protein